MYPKKFNDLVDILKKLPGVGEKTAQRYAFQVLNWSKQEIEDTIEVFKEIQEGIKTCKVCGCFCDGDECLICKDPSRNKNIICVVQSIKDVIAMEKTNEYQGTYHVLNGVISTSKGILPDDLNIESLVERINEDIEEVIIATNPTVEGETTALYLSKLLENKNVKVSRIAYGIPMGGHLDYADELTLIKALEGRKSM